MLIEIKQLEKKKNGLMRRCISVIILMNILFLNSCAQENKEIEYGQLIGNNYQNEQFDLSINIPEDWYFIDKNRRPMLAKKNAERILANTDKPEEYIETTIEKTALIFTIFKFRPDTLIEVNPNITITATNIGEYPKLKDVKYAIEQTKAGLKEINQNFIFGNEVIAINVNQKEFKGYKSSVTINNLTANYESYLSNYEDFNILITISFKTESERKELINILKQISRL